MLLDRIRALREEIKLSEKDSGIETALKNKAKENALDYETLKKIFQKGEKAWEADPSTKYNKYQLGHEFVDNYIKGKKGK